MAEHAKLETRSAEGLPSSQPEGYEQLSDEDVEAREAQMESTRRCGVQLVRWRR